MPNRVGIPDPLPSLPVRIYVSLRRDDGQGLTEYALIIALIVLVAIVALSVLGGSANDALSTVGSSMLT